MLEPGGQPEPPGTPRRSTVLGALLVVLVGVAVLVGRDAVRDRAEQRVADAALAPAAEVHLDASLLWLAPGGPGTSRVDVMVEVVGREDRADPERLTGLVVEAGGLTPLEFVRPPSPERRLQVAAAAAVDCGAVATGRLPPGGDAVLTITPASGVPHDQRLPLPPTRLREALLIACDLPDPDAETTVEASGASGGVFVSLMQVPRRPEGLVVEGIAVPGFEVVLDGLSLPYRLPPGTGLGLFLTVRVRDCAAALAGDLRVQVTLTEGGVTTVREGSSSASQPGAVPAARYLQGLLDAACP